MKPIDNDYTRQLALIRDHLDAMCDDKLAEEIGANKDRALHVRVLRYLDHLNDVREENAKLREEKARLDWMQSRYVGGEPFGLPFPLIRKHDSIRDVLDIMRQREAQRSESSEKN